MEKLLNKKISLNPDVILQEVGENTVMLHLNDNQYYSMNNETTPMWNVLISANNIDEAIDELHSQYDIKREVLTEDMMSFLEELQKRDIISLVSCK